MKLLYLDASVALHALLSDGDRRAREWIEGVARRDLYSSSLLGLEIKRVLRRDGVDVQIAGQILGRVNLVAIDDGVLDLAGAIESHVRALDAIHLATAMILGSGVTVVTHDAAMALAGRTLGLETVDPLE